MSNNKSHMQMLREMLAKEEYMNGEEGIIRLCSKDGNFTVGDEVNGAYRSVSWNSAKADTLEHAIEQAHAAIVGEG